MEGSRDEGREKGEGREEMMPKSKAVRTYRDLEVYEKAFDAARRLFQITKKFPPEERYSLTDQLRRSSRSVAVNIHSAWRKRRYPASFVSKLSDAEEEAGESQTWIEFAVDCGYVDRKEARGLFKSYNEIIGKLVQMMHHPQKWALKKDKQEREASE